MYDFEDISFALNHAANDESPSQVVVSELDVIDKLFSQEDWRSNLKSIEDKLKSFLDQIKDVIKTPGYHSELISCVGRLHVMSYSQLSGPFRLIVKLHKSGVSLCFTKLETDFDYKCIKRHAVVLTSTSAPGARKTKHFSAAKPIADRYSFRGAGNVFLPPIALSKIKKFKTHKNPKMSARLLPVLIDKEIEYLKHAIDNYPNCDQGVAKQQYISTIKSFSCHDFDEYMGTLYQWGLVNIEHEVLYFNTDVIKQILTKLQSIDFMGVTPRDSNTYFAVIDHLLQGKIVRMTSIPRTGVVRLQAQGLMTFNEKETGITKSYTICTATQKGIDIYNTWVDIYKLVEPYVQQVRNKHN